MSDLGSTSTPAPGWEQQQPAPPAYAGKGSGPRAGFWRRFASALLDGILLGVVHDVLIVLLNDRPWPACSCS